MILDPVYWIVIGVTTVLSLWASARVKGTFAKYSKMPTSSRMTGRDVAEAILRDNDIHDVRVEGIRGQLTDHYDPTTKTLRLSEPVYGQSTMAAFGVAAHEVGHAIQHATGYAPLKFRSKWVPVVNIGSNVSFIALFAAMALGGAQTVLGKQISILAVALFGCMTVFTLVTLPVEFNASNRALATLENGGYLRREELVGARKVLNAAALTYVAAFISSLAMLIYWMVRLGLLGGRDD